ncbi:hypothetical protein Vafri_14214 [Volvox africanus]|uniref:J domain-containing protein n=1 Tax=Volvox africanus TaxID=51714 RepID=A0A8J4BI96_9CHLO|nr:hypothetical protein Vafri_14214 [Volvox africanus]
MATVELIAAYDKLGVMSTASKAEVKEAFVRLCKQCHPDKVPAAQRAVAEARFRDIKEAYDTILRGQAGYNVPPPGSGPNAKYARAYYRAHGMGMDFGERGPIRCGGPFGGFATEWDFYRAMFRCACACACGVRAKPVSGLRSPHSLRIYIDRNLWIIMRRALLLGPPYSPSRLVLVYSVSVPGLVLFVFPPPDNFYHLLPGSSVECVAYMRPALLHPLSLHPPLPPSRSSLSLSDPHG